MNKTKEVGIAMLVGSILAYHRHTSLLQYLDLPGVVEEDDDSPFGALEKVDMRP